MRALKNPILQDYLAFSKNKIIEKICYKADLKGKESWLFLPEQPCFNPRICLVAHIDTVFDADRKNWYDCGINLKNPVSEMNPIPRKLHRKKIFYDQKKQIFWSPSGLGADDRAGVYACMLLRNQTGCMVLLTDYEECGGSGAREAATIFRQYFDNIAFFLEIDRKGKSEMVFYNGESQKFKDFIHSFGFSEHSGSFTDISILGRETGIVGVNVSAGYYNQHTRQEYQNVKHLNDTIDKVKKIIMTGGDKYDTEKWKISKPIYPEFSRYHDSGTIQLHSDRRRKSPKMACRWEF